MILRRFFFLPIYIFDINPRDIRGSMYYKYGLRHGDANQRMCTQLSPSEEISPSLLLLLLVFSRDQFLEFLYIYPFFPFFAVSSFRLVVRLIEFGSNSTVFVRIVIVIDKSLSNFLKRLRTSSGTKVKICKSSTERTGRSISPSLLDSKKND